MVNKIFELRKKLNMTQQELADALEINRSTINHWELSHRPIPSNELVRMADYFDVTIDYLLGRTGLDMSDKTDVTSMERLPNETFTDGMNGKPVYSRMYGWLLINKADNVCIDMRGRKYGIDTVGEVYINSPETFPYHLKFDAPIDVDELKDMKDRTIWVEPLMDDMQINGMIRGWFTVGDGIVTNDIGFRLYFATYGNQWNAFEKEQ